MTLLGRLRQVCGDTTRFYVNPDGPEAADEIERLREALRKIAEFDLYGDYSNGYEIPKIAAQALLQQKENE